MIDPVFVTACDLAAGAGLYDRILMPLGLQRLVTRDKTIGDGKRHREFWLKFAAGPC